MVRTLRPTDVVGLLLSGQELGVNEAVTKEGLGREATPSTISYVLRAVASASPYRQTWLHTQRSSPKGIVSARRRSSFSCWELDLLAMSLDSCSACPALLEQFSISIGQKGAQKLFLRVSAASPLLNIISQTSFTSFRCETLFGFAEHLKDSKGTQRIVERVRPQLPQDEFSLFHLYCTAVPRPVRCVEGLTFKEWHEFREFQGIRGSRTFVYEIDATVQGALRVIPLGSCTMLEVLSSQASEEVYSGLLAFGLAQARSASRIIALAPESDGVLRSTLAQHGFVARGDYLNFVNQTSGRVKEPFLQLVRA